MSYKTQEHFSISTEETDQLLAYSSLEMGGNDADERRKHSNSNSINNIIHEKEEEDEEALSLCDLPINDEENKLVSRKDAPKPINDSQEEFNFCSSLGTDSLSKESEMCAADEIFFQGQILPLRHSVSSESGLITKLQSDGGTTSRCISRTESMDHCYSVGFTSESSRSSSINSHNSLSSGTASSTTTGTGSKHKPRPKIRNHFQIQYSHPSPKPQIRSSNIKNGINGNNSNRKSTFWSIFRVGLVTTPEIAIQDLKFRTNSKTSFGSRNSTSSISSSKIKTDERDQIKKQQKFFDTNGVLFFRGCKWSSSNAVAGPIPSRVRENVTRRSGSVNEAHANEEMKKPIRTTKQHQQQAGKQTLSRHRTFEWLKQLSLEDAAVIDEA